MTKKSNPRIVEIHLKISKKNPKYCHAIAILFPCSHKLYLGVAKTPKDMKGHFIRTTSIRIWKPIDYELTDKMYCKDCPNDLIWLKDIPTIKEAEADKDGLDYD